MNAHTHTHTPHARFAIISKHGGIYLDTDVEPVHNMDPLIDYIGAFLVCDTPSTETNIILKSCELRERVANAMLGFPPGHYLPVTQYQKVVEASWKRIRAGKLGINVEETGPALWNRVALTVKPENVTFVGTQTFQPCKRKRRLRWTCKASDYANSTDVFGMHKFEFSWAKYR